MGCATGTVKYLLFIFNFVFALIGLGILIAGALSYADIKEVDQHLKNVDVNGSPIGLIVLGSIVFVIAFYGCCGAIRESHCMIVTFAVFLIIILITQIAIGIVAFVKRDGWDKILDENLSQTFDKYGTDAATNESINALQHTIVGVVFALCLANSIKEKERRRGKY